MRDDRDEREKANEDENPPAEGTTPEGDISQSQVSAGISFDTMGSERSPEKRLQESLDTQGGQSLFEAGGTLEPSAPPVSRYTPRTGVGTPDEQAQAGGAELGGDSGDVDITRNEVGGTPGSPHGASGEPETRSATPRSTGPVKKRGDQDERAA